jgi:hypothetical protein
MAKWDKETQDTTRDYTNSKLIIIERTQACLNPKRRLAEQGVVGPDRHS